MNDAPKVADAALIPERFLRDGEFWGLSWRQQISALRELDALEAENRQLKESLSDSVTVHVNILRGTIALTKAQAIHIAGLPADIEQTVAQLKEIVSFVSHLSAATYSPWHSAILMARKALATQEPAQTEGKGK